MLIHISTNDGVPIYQQIVTQVKYLVASGRLAVGDEMPAIRKLAEMLIVNPNTVARAYAELERQGVVSCRKGAGTRILASESPLSDNEKARILAERADALLSEARQLGVNLDDIIELIHERDSEMNPATQETEK